MTAEATRRRRTSREAPRIAAPPPTWTIASRVRPFPDSSSRNDPCTTTEEAPRRSSSTTLYDAPVRRLIPKNVTSWSAQQAYRSHPYLARTSSKKSCHVLPVSLVESNSSMTSSPWAAIQRSWRRSHGVGGAAIAAQKASPVASTGAVILRRTSERRWRTLDIVGEAPRWRS